MISVTALWIAAALAVAIVLRRRLRADAVAILALLAALWAGIVPPERAFAGFADPFVASVALLAVAGTAVRDSGLVEAGLRSAVWAIRMPSVRVPLLGALAAALAAVVGSTRCIAAFEPVMRMAALRGASGAPSRWPVAVGATFGALGTFFGTPAALLAYRALPEELRQASRLLAPLPVGAALAGLGLLVVAWLRHRRATAQGETAEVAFEPDLDRCTAELRVAPGSPLANLLVRDVERRSGTEVAVIAIVREEHRRFRPGADWVIEPGDVLVVAGQPEHVLRAVEEAHPMTRSIRAPVQRQAVAEAVVTTGSTLDGRSTEEVRLASRFGLALIAVARRGSDIGVRLQRAKLRSGDVLFLAGAQRALPEAMTSLGCLLLAERRLRIGLRGGIWLPLGLLLAALAASMLSVVPLSSGLLVAVLVLVAIGAVDLEDVYAVIPWPVIVTAGALLPVIAAGETGGQYRIAAATLHRAMDSGPATLILGVLTVAAFLLSRLLDGVTAALLLAPLAAVPAGERSGPVVLAIVLAIALGAAFEFPPASPEERRRPRLATVLMLLLLLAGPLLVRLVTGP